METKLKYQALQGSARELLTAARTYYVRTDGIDTNTGLTNDVAGAFKTIQRAVDVVSGLDINGNNVVIQVGTGTYNEGVSLKNVAGFASGANLTLRGDTTTPSNCYINGGVLSAVSAAPTSVWNVEGFRVGGGNGIAAIGGSIRVSALDYYTVVNYQNIATIGGVITFYGNYKISGAGGPPVIHLAAIDHGTIFVAGVRCDAMTNLSYACFASSNRFSLIAAHSSTFAPNAYTVTGIRYGADGNSVVFVNGGGANYFPGNTVGVLNSGGQYY